MELKEVKKEESYWYPFSKGVNRILIVILGFSIESTLKRGIF